MGRAKAIFIVSIMLLTLAVTVAGFFYDEGQPATRSVDQGRASTHVAGPQPAAPGLDMEERSLRKFSANDALRTAPSETVPSYGTEGKAYQRDAALALRVNDVFETLSKVEKMVGDAKGWLESVDVSGNTTSHDGTLRVVIPSDKFTEVFGAFRKLGDLQTERITSHRVASNNGPANADAQKNQTELVHVDMTLSDNPERLAQTKLGAVMSTAWTRGMEHFGKGGAVLLESLGYVMPFFLVFGGLLAAVGLFTLVARIGRRLTAPKVPYMVPVSE